LGCYSDGNSWRWRLQISSFPTISDPYVASLALRNDNLKFAVLFISSTAAEGGDAYLAEYGFKNGDQTSKTKLKLPGLSWAGSQSMTYLEDSDNTLMVVLTTKPDALSNCVIAAINFAN
jgi:hypothetical protein